MHLIGMRVISPGGTARSMFRMTQKVDYQKACGVREGYTAAGGRVID